MRVRKYATYATVDEPVVTFNCPIIPRKDWWITIKFGRLMGWIRGTNAIGADGLSPIRTEKINLYKELYGPLIKLITRPFRVMALQHALGADAKVINLVIALTWETYTPNKSRHWRVYMMLEEHLRLLDTITMAEDDKAHRFFSRQRTLRIIAKQYIADRADTNSPDKFGIAEIAVPRALLSSPSKLAHYLATHLAGTAPEWMVPDLPPEKPRVSRPKGRRIGSRT